MPDMSLRLMGWPRYGIWGVVAIALHVMAWPSEAVCQAGFTIAELKATHPESNFGEVIRIADLDMDGFSDLVIGHTAATVDGVSLAGSLFIVHGPLLQDMVEVASDVPSATEIMAGDDIDIGDADGDGWPDLLVSASRFDAPGYENAGRAHLFFGPDFEREFILDDPTPETGGHFGSSTLFVDRDEDGSDELVIGVPEASVWQGPVQVMEAGEVYIFDIDSWDAPLQLVEPVAQTCSRFGFDLEVGDTDGDGKAELLVSSAGHCFEADPYRSASISIFQLPGLLLDQSIAPPTTSGVANEFLIHHVGDLTSDGVVDVLAGCPNCSDPTPCIGQGVAWILPGPTFDSVAYSLVSPACDTLFFGSHVAVADVDHDGLPDVAIGDPGEQTGGNDRTYVFHGPDYFQVTTLGPDEISLLGFGSEVAAGDLDGDGFAEVAVWGPEGPLAFSDTVFVFKKVTLQADSTSLSLSSGGSVTFAYDGGLLESGHDYVAVLTASGAEPGTIPQKGLWVPLNVDAVTMMGLALLGSSVLQDFQGQLDPSGKASFVMNIKPGQAGSLAGKSLTVSVVTVADGNRLSSVSSFASISLLR